MARRITFGYAFQITLALSGAMLVGTFIPPAVAQTIPQFKQFLVSQIHRGLGAEVDLGPAENRKYRTRLRQASKEPANFAGHHVLTIWGCGNRCVTGAAINLLSGKVSFLPATVCCWGDVDDNFRAVEYRLDSRLIVLSGQLAEQEPMGAHFFEFDGDRFNRLTTVLMNDDFRSRAVTASPKRQQDTDASPHASAEHSSVTPAGKPSVKICNETRKGVSVVIVHGDSENAKNHIMSGWYNISQSQCRTFSFQKGPLYAFALQDGGRAVWPAKGYIFCIAPRRIERTIFEGEECIPGEGKVAFDLIAQGNEPVWRLR